MTTYRKDGIKWNRANWAKLPADCAKGINSFIASRETALNTFTTSEVIYDSGPFAGQTIELSDDSPTMLDFNFKGWVGCYEGSKWVGTIGEPLTVYPDPGRLSKSIESPQSKGFQALGDLLTQMATEPKTQIVQVTKHAVITYGLVDDFGFSINLDYDAPFPVDDFGTAYRKPVRHVEPISYRVFKDRAIYQVGRLTYKINPASVDRLRAAILAKKRFFSDKALGAYPVFSKEVSIKDFALPPGNLYQFCAPIKTAPAPILAPVAIRAPACHRKPRQWAPTWPERIKTGPGLVSLAHRVIKFKPPGYLWWLNRALPVARKISPVVYSTIKELHGTAKIQTSTSAA